MNIQDLPPVVTRRKKRLGQGEGSGKGKTAGRGTKGQKARETVKPGFEGGQLKLIKRLPLIRGKLRNKSRGKNPFVLNVDDLNKLPNGTEVDVETLIAYHLVSDKAKQQGVKILGDGSLSVSLAVSIPVSKGAKEKIEKAGGSITNDSINKS